MSTIDCRILTESCHHFHHWELIINRLTIALFGLTRALFRLNGVIFSLTRVIFRLTGVKFRLTQVQTFTTISLNNPVYGKQSIMEITRYLFKKVCNLQSAFYPQFAVCILPSVSMLRSAVCSLRFTLTGLGMLHVGSHDPLARTLYRLVRSDKSTVCMHVIYDSFSLEYLHYTPYETSVF